MACDPDRAAATTDSAETGVTGTCATDADCTAGMNGRCSRGFAPDFTCSYDQCQVDSDCPSGSVCTCGPAPDGARYLPNLCTAGNCVVDADCGPGAFCSPSLDGCGNTAGFYCHSAADLCAGDSDCTGSIHCTYIAEDSRWECGGGGVCEE